VNAQADDGIVHLVIVTETKYEYGLTACRRDFVWAEGERWFAQERAVDYVEKTTNPFTCIYCAVAEPWGWR
jgi:hypothetical protein